MRLMPKTWKRRVAATVALLVLTTLACKAIDYARWYRPGEAHYLGRPTSWWATHCQTGTLDVQSFQASPTGWVSYWNYQPVPAGQLYEQTGGSYPAEPFWHEWVAVLGIRLDRYDRESLWLMRGDPAAVPVLLELLGDPKRSVRHAAIYGLAVVGNKSPDAVTAVESCVNDKDEFVQEFARYSLRRIDPKAAKRARVPDEAPDAP